MKKKFYYIIILIILLLITVLAYYFYAIDKNNMNRKMINNTLSKEVLKEAVRKNIMVFGNYFPEKMIDMLGRNKVIIFGEYHWVREEQELAAKLFNQLNKEYGINQILLEQPNGYSWRYNEYLQGNISNLSNPYLMTLLDIIREYIERSGRDIKAYCISCNHSPQQYVDNFAGLLDYLEIEENSIVIEQFNAIRDKINGEGYKNILESFNQDLTDRMKEYKRILGDKYYVYVKSMTMAEIDSIAYRKNSEQGYTEGFITRENIMKKLTDYHIADNDGGTFIYIGFYHGQKKHYMGTDHEWIARYLKYNSPYARGKTFSLPCVPLKGIVNKDVKMNLLKYPPEHELFKVMSETSNNDKAFLSLDDDIFNSKDILVNYHFKKLAIPVGIQFDGFIIIPEATSLEDNRVSPKLIVKSSNIARMIVN